MPPSSSTSSKENVRVVVRARPVNTEKDAAYNESNAFRFDMKNNTVSRTGEKVQGQNELRHTFDAVFEDAALGHRMSMAEKQTVFFEQHVRPLIDRALAQGINLSILSYGHTGSGKTHSIDGKNHHLLGQQQQQQRTQHYHDDDDSEISFGADGKNGDEDNEAVEGIVSLAMNRCVSILEPKSKEEREQAENEHLHETSQNSSSNGRNSVTSPSKASNNNSVVWMRLAVKFVEIYNDKLVDLLAAAVAPKRSEESDKLLRLRLRRREDGEDVFYVENLLCFECDSVADAMMWYRRGAQQKTFRSHKINAHSSRSHCIFTMVVTICSRAEDGVSLNRRTFEMNFVDLAGSERPDKIAIDESKVDMRQRLKAQKQQQALYSESLHINGSLSTLGRVIAALSKGSHHVPFRESKLTSLLRHALGSNGLLLFIACVAANNIPETTRTLVFASQARTIRVVASPVQDANALLIAQLRARIKELEGDLAAALAMNPPNANNFGVDGGSNNNNNQEIASSTTNEFVGENESEEEDELPEFELKDSRRKTTTSTNNNSTTGNKNTTSANNNNNNNNSRELLLSQSLYSACTKMQDLLKSNSNLRSQIDDMRNDQDNVGERLSELERENLNLREKLDILNSVVSVEAKTTESLLRAAVHGNSNYYGSSSSYSSRYGMPSSSSRTKSSPSMKKNSSNNKTSSSSPKTTTGQNGGKQQSNSSPSSFIYASHPSLIPATSARSTTNNQQNNNNSALPPLAQNNNNNNTGRRPSSTSRRSTTSTPNSSNPAAVGLPISLFGGGGK